MASMERKFTLNVPSSTGNLAMIRDFVNSVGAQAGMSATEVGQLELAVDEACANVIEHAYGHDSTKEVSVRATIDGDTMEIDVIDTGQGFDPAAVEQLELEKLISERMTGGLGMRLMKTLMDEVHYAIIPGEKNELRMIKRLKKSK
jgi:serine/threonine-protein kinase RsbW